MATFPDDSVLVNSAGEEEIAGLMTSRTAPEAKPQKWRRFGLAMGALVVLGVVGLNMKGFIQNDHIQLRSMTPQSVMAAFEARLLGSDMSTTETEKFSFYAEGEPKPEAMKMTVNLQQSKSKKEKRVSVSILAKIGKGDALRKQLNDIVSEIDSSGPKISVRGKGDKAVIQLNGPDDDDDDPVITGQPKLSLEVAFGRTIRQMYEHKNSNIAALPGGVSFKGSVTIANLMFQEWLTHLPLPRRVGNFAQKGTPFLKAISKITVTEEVRYNKAELENGPWSHLPSLGEAIDELSRQLKQALPPKIMTLLTGLQDNADGFESIKLTGLQHNYQIVADFTHFHPSHLIASLLSSP